METTGKGEKGKTLNVKQGWFVLSLVLLVCLCISVGFNVYQRFNFSEGPSNSYVFYFYNDYIRNDTAVRVEVTFDWQAENLSMTVTVNDDEYNEWDYLGVVFDKNNNGTIDLEFEDEPYALYVDNKTRSQGQTYLYKWGGLGWVIIESSPSPYHTCTFDEETGYTFKISLSRQDINVEAPTPIHICFYDVEKWIEAAAASERELVWVQFEVK